MEFRAMFEHTQRITPMGHDGRFNLPTKISAVIASFADTTVLLEHPAPPKPVNNRFRMAAMSLPWAKAEFSLCDWQPGMVAAITKSQKQTILAAEAAVAGAPLKSQDDNAQTPPRSCCFSGLGSFLKFLGGRT
jgi:hypothetical protein